MDTLDDAAIYRAESEIRRRRLPQPCDDYQAASRAIPLCENCGWDHSKGLDRK